MTIPEEISEIQHILNRISFSVVAHMCVGGNAAFKTTWIDGHNVEITFSIPNIKFYDSMTLKTLEILLAFFFAPRMMLEIVPGMFMSPFKRFAAELVSAFFNCNLWGFKCLECPRDSLD